jgi:hypothetical protein
LRMRWLEPARFVRIRWEQTNGPTLRRRPGLRRGTLLYGKEECPEEGRPSFAGGAGSAAKDLWAPRNKEMPMRVRESRSRQGACAGHG